MGGVALLVSSESAGWCDILEGSLLKTGLHESKVWTRVLSVCNFVCASGYVSDMETFWKVVVYLLSF